MTPPVDPPDATFWTNAGILVAALVSGAYAYFKQPKKPELISPPAAVITGVGMELGSREQTERLITAVNGVAAAIRDKKQDEMQDTMDSLLEELKRQGK